MSNPCCISKTKMKKNINVYKMLCQLCELLKLPLHFRGFFILKYEGTTYNSYRGGIIDFIFSIGK